MKNLKHFSKRGLALILALIMCLSMVNLSAFAAETPDSVYVCGQEEHIHTDECRRSDTPVCGLEETPTAPSDEGEDVNIPGEGESDTNDPDEGEGDASNPGEGEGDTSTPDEGEGDTNNPGEGEGDTTTPDEGESDAATPGEGEGDTTTPGEGDGDANNPGEGEGDANNPSEGEGDTTTSGEGEGDTTTSGETVTPEVTEPTEKPAPEESEPAPIEGEAIPEPMNRKGKNETVDAAEDHTHTDDCYISDEPLCGLEEHEHSLDCYVAYHELVAGMDVFFEHFGEFYAEFCANLSEEYVDEYGNLTEVGMSALAEASALALGDEMNALIDLYKQIPDHFLVEGSEYHGLVANLEQYAGMMGGDLDSGIETLAGKTNIYNAGFPRNHQTARETLGRPGGTLMGNWSAGSTESWTLHIVNGYSGPIAYCIEPGEPSSKTGLDAMTGSSSYDSLSTAQKKLIGRILASDNAYTGTVTTNNTYGANSKTGFARAIATQLLIWEVVVGERDENFNHVYSPRGGAKPVFSSDGTKKDGIMIGHNPKDVSGNDFWGTIKTQYNNIVSDVTSHSTMPSFFGTTVNLTASDWDNEKQAFVKTLTDNNGVLTQFLSDGSKSGISWKVNGNRLTVTISAENATKSISGTKNQSDRKGLYYYTDSTQQNVVTVKSTKTDNLSGAVTFTTPRKPVTSVTINKAWSSNTPTDVMNAMTVTVALYDGSTAVGTATLSNGHWSQTFDNLTAGKSYTVQETGITFSAVSGYTVQKENGLWLVSKDGKVVGAFKPTVSGTTVTNTWYNATDNGSVQLTFNKVGNTAYGPQNVALSGAEFTLAQEGKSPKTATSSDGSVSFSFDTNDAGIWIMTETKAPDGYDKTDESWTVTVDKTFTSVTYNGNAPVNNYDMSVTVADAHGNVVENVVVTNNHTLADLAVTKTVTWDPAYSQTPPANSEFTFKVTLSGTQPKSGESMTEYSGAGEYILTTMLTQASIDSAETNDDGTKTATCAVQTISNIPTGTTYSIEETMPENFNVLEIASGTVAPAVGVTTVEAPVRNRYFNSLTTTISGIKSWGEITEIDALIPFSIDVALNQSWTENGVSQTTAAYKTTQVTKDDDWTYTFAEVPLWKSENVRYSYAVEETGITYDGSSGKALVDYLNKQDGTTGKVYHKVEQIEGTNIFKVLGEAKTANGEHEVLGVFVVSYSENGYDMQNDWTAGTDLGSGNFTVKKVDADDPDMGLEGAYFELKSNEGTRWFWQGARTNKDGEATFYFIPGGTYTLTEVTAPEGHLINETEWTVVVSKENLVRVYDENGNQIKWNNQWNWTTSSNVNGESTSDSVLVVRDARIEGRISIVKHLDLDGTIDPDSRYNGQEFIFDIYVVETMFKDQEQYKDSPIASLTVKSDGTTATMTDPLDYGTYKIVERERGTIEHYGEWLSILFAGEDEDGFELLYAEDGKTVIGCKVVVSKQDQKVEIEATNSYTRDTGSLAVSKDVTGVGDRTADWQFTVTLHSDLSYVSLLKDGKVNDTYTYTYTITDKDGNAVGQPGQTLTVVPETELDAEGKPTDKLTGDITATITLKDGQMAVISGVPVGVTYTVAETGANSGDYRTTYKTLTVGTDRDRDTSTANSYNAPVSGVRPVVRLVNESDTPLVAFTNYLPSDDYTTSYSVQKVWRNDEGVERPTEITVTLLHDGVPYGSAVTLSAANGWSYTWNFLPLTGTWDLTEGDVPEGYTSAVTRSGNTFVVTNTYTEPEEPEEPEQPEEDIPNDDVPLDELELVDGDVPLANVPEEEEELVDEDIPLAGAPATGDDLGLWLTAAAMSALGLGWMLRSGKRKEDEEA